MHLLCYGFNSEVASAKQMIAEGARLRRQRIANMFDHLRTKRGITIPDEDKVEILARAVV